MAIFTAQELLKKHGVTPEQVNSSPIPTTEQPLQTVGGAIQGAGQNVFNAVSGQNNPNQSPLERGISATSAAFNAVPAVAVAALPDIVQKPVEQAGQIVASGFDKLTSLLGSNPALQKWTQDHPEATAGLERALTTVSDVGNIAGNIAGIDTAAKGMTAISNKISEVPPAVAQEFEKIGSLTGIKGIEAANKLNIAPENLMQRVARISKGKQANFEKMSGESVGTYLVKRNIFGTPEQVTQQLFNRMEESMKKVDTGLSKVSGNYRSPSVLTAIRDLQARESSISSIGSPSSDLSRVNELAKLHKTKGLSLEQINEVKRLYERNVKVDYLKSINPTGVARATNIDSKLRNLIETKATEKGASQLKSLNKETQLAKQLLDDIGAEYAGQQGNNAISLSDAMFLAQSTANPTALAAFGIKKFAGSKYVMSKAAQIMSKDAGTKAVLPKMTVNNKTVPQGYGGFIQKQILNK